MSPRPKKRHSALEQRRKKSRHRPNEFGISAAAYPDGRIAVLLSHYPELSKPDFDEVVRFIRKARPAQLQRLRSSEAVRTNLDRFLVDQRALLPTDRERVTWTIFAIAILLFLCWLFWDQRPHPLAPRAPATVLSAAASGLAMGPHSEARSNARNPRQPGQNVAMKRGIVLHAGDLQSQHVVASTRE